MSDKRIRGNDQIMLTMFQVAEMHGELLEFNEHLQKTIQSKDGFIRRLRDELVSRFLFLPVSVKFEKSCRIN